MSSLTLFEIAHEFKQITDVLQDSGCDEQTLLDTLEGESWSLDLKAQNYAFVIKNLEANSYAIKEAEETMAKRRKAIDNRANYLKERLKTGMEIAGVSKLSCPHFDLSIQKNPPSVYIFEEKLIPDKFMRQAETPPPAPDKKEIKSAIERGEDVPGAKIVQGTRLKIG